MILTLSFFCKMQPVTFVKVFDLLKIYANSIVCMKLGVIWPKLKYNDNPQPEQGYNDFGDFF